MFSFKSSHQRCSVKKVFLKISPISKETPVLEPLLNKAAGLQVCNFIKKILQHRYFPVKFEKFFITPILKNICERLLCSFFLIAPVLEFLHNKFASLQICNFIRKRLQHRCFPVKLVKFLRTLILKSICERLLL